MPLRSRHLFRFLPKFLRNRAEKVRSDIESARKATEDANARLSAVETKLSKLDEEKVAEMRLRDETLQALLKSGITVTNTFEVTPGTYLVRLVARDAEGQQLTVENAAVQIPAIVGGE